MEPPTNLFKKHIKNWIIQEESEKLDFRKFSKISRLGLEVPAGRASAAMLHLPSFENTSFLLHNFSRMKSPVKKFFVT